MMVRGKGGNLTRVVWISVNGATGATRPCDLHSSSCPFSSCSTGSAALLAKLWSNQLPLSVSKHWSLKSRRTEHNITVPITPAAAEESGFLVAQLSGWQNTGEVHCQQRTIVSAITASQHWVGGVGPLVHIMGISSQAHSIQAAAHRYWARLTDLLHDSCVDGRPLDR